MIHSHGVDIVHVKYLNNMQIFLGIIIIIVIIISRLCYIMYVT